MTISGDGREGSAEGTRSSPPPNARTYGGGVASCLILHTGTNHDLRQGQRLEKPLALESIRRHGPPAMMPHTAHNNHGCTAPLRSNGTGIHKPKAKGWPKQTSSVEVPYTGIVGIARL